MNVYQFQQSTLSEENNVNFITKNIDGTYMVCAVNRAMRSRKYAMRGKNYINYKTFKGAINAKVAKQNGGVNVIVEPHGTDMRNTSYTIMSKL